MTVVSVDPGRRDGRVLMRRELTVRQKLAALIVVGGVVAVTSIVTVHALLSNAFFAGQPSGQPQTRSSAEAGIVAEEDLTPELLQNAACVVAAASEQGLGPDAQLIGITTALGESGLTVLDYGDDAGPDSRGLFQQRDNGAWGSLAERMDPFRSAENFFIALEDVDGWQSMTPSEAAHEVQRNADPDHYTSHVPFAKVVLQRVEDDGTSCPSE